MRELVCINDESRQAILLRPWEREPYRLFSWWDMEKFAAHAFVALGKLLERIGAVHHKFEDKSLTDEAKHGLEDFLSAIHDACLKIALRFSLSQVDRIKAKLSSSTITHREVASLLEALEERIRDEMRVNLFMFIPSDRADFFNKTNLFGLDVTARFPGLQFDITEAGIVTPQVGEPLAFFI